MTLIEAIAAAREAIRGVTELPFDGIAKAEPQKEGGWKVRVEVIESRARMGDDDLLTQFDLTLDKSGGLIGFERAGRYRRLQGAAA